MTNLLVCVLFSPSSAAFPLIWHYLSSRNEHTSVLSCTKFSFILTGKFLPNRNEETRLLSSFVISVFIHFCLVLIGFEWCYQKRIPSAITVLLIVMMERAPIEILGCPFWSISWFCNITRAWKGVFRCWILAPWFLHIILATLCLLDQGMMYKDEKLFPSLWNILLTLCNRIVYKKKLIVCY